MCRWITSKGVEIFPNTSVHEIFNEIIRFTDTWTATITYFIVSILSLYLLWWNKCKKIALDLFHYFFEIQNTNFFLENAKIFYCFFSAVIDCFHEPSNRKFKYECLHVPEHYYKVFLIISTSQIMFTE